MRSKSFDKVVIPKNLKEPVKYRKRVVKKGEKSSGEVKYTLLREDSNDRVDDLFRVYKDDPYKARVKFMNTGGKFFGSSRVVLFEYGNNFEICEFFRYVGISKTNRIYSRQNKVRSISYKDGKFWYINRNIVRPLCYGLLIDFINQSENLNLYNRKKEDFSKSKVFTYINEHFSWVTMLFESPISHAVSFNVIKSKKLYSMNDFHKHVMKVPINVVKTVIKSGFFVNGYSDKLNLWKGIIGVLDNVESLKVELIKDDHFTDACRLAKILDKKVNCSWSNRRLKEEHDKWSVELNAILLDCEVEYDLNVAKIFRLFSEFSGYKLLTKNKDMISEGMVQKHCVSSYVNKVNGGLCGIYHIDGYTLELGVELFSSNTFNRYKENFNGIMGEVIDDLYKGNRVCLVNKQFRGKFNTNAPQYLVDEVNQKIVNFLFSSELTVSDCGGVVSRGLSDNVVDINNFYENDVDFGIF